MEHLALGLFFRDEDIPALRARIKQPRYQTLWGVIRSTADAVVDAGDVLLPNATFTIWYYIRNNLMDLAMAALVTEDERYIRTVNKILARVADSDMNFWQGPEYPNRPRTLVYHGETRLAGELETAAITTGVCVAFDWCYSYLDEDVKVRLLAALREKGQMLLRNSVQFQSEKWVMNHLCVLSAALTLSSFVLRSVGDDTAADLAIARRGLELWMEKTEDDGSYGEAYHYWAYPANCLFFGMYAFYRMEGITLRGLQRFANGFVWGLHNQVGLYSGIKGFDQPVAVAVNSYDCPFVFQMESPETLLFAKLLKQPLANWYIDHFLINDPPQPDSLHNGWHTCRSLLLALDDPTAPRLSPEEYGLPLDRYFADTGFVYMRDSWRNAGEVGGDMVFELQSGGGGRTCSHEHYDKNSYSLFAYGEYLITDPGHSCYRGRSHKEYDTRTSSHNTLCVNGANQSLAFVERGMLHDEAHTYRSFRNQAQIVGRNFNPHISYVASDARRCYEPYLNAFTRHVFFVRPDYFLIWDHIDASNVPGDAENGFNVNNHDGKTVFTASGGCLLAERPQASVNVQYAFPPDITLTRKDAKLHLAYHILPHQPVEGDWGSAVRFTPQVGGGYPGRVDYIYTVCPLHPGESLPQIELLEAQTEPGAPYALRSGRLAVTFRDRRTLFSFDGERIVCDGSQGEHYEF